MLHRITPTKEFLFKIGKVENDHCTFWGNGTQTFEHVFFINVIFIVQPFWKAILQIYLVPKETNNINLTDFIVGINTEKLDILPNQIIIFINLYLMSLKTGFDISIFNA